jgi:hypothetical protein
MKTFVSTRVVMLSFLLIFALLAATAPTQALAATQCVSYHTFRAGERTGAIAHSYGLSWTEIAKANNLGIGERPSRGDRLCIPAAKTSTSGSSNFNLTATGSGNVFRLGSTGSKSSAVWIVKARENGGSWYRLGRWRVGKGENTTMSFGVPNDLRGKSPLQVCFKNATTDEAICRTVAFR